MIHRTYIVKAPTTSDVLDIVVEGPVGFTSTAAATTPGVKPYAPVQLSNAPVGWNGTDGAYYEILGKTLGVPLKALISGSANPAFVPRFRLGWGISFVSLDASILSAAPSVLLSQSLVGNLGTTDGTIVLATLADPSYGPVIRLTGLSDEGFLGQLFALHLRVMEPKDEDRNPIGV